jgi:glycosyltransferase involved in cell wall biosynthesis
MNVPINLETTAGRSGGVLSVIVPVFNEIEALREFHTRLARTLEALDLSAEVLYVNDGSTDGSLDLLRDLRALDRRVGIVDLSRNFGKEAAMTAGLDHARGDAVVIIDADLQDPPELITELVRQWRRGFDVVYAQRVARDGETPIKKFTAYLFYRLIQRTNRVRVPLDTGDYRLLSRRAVDSLMKLRETHRFMKGLFAWIGHPQIAVPYHRDRRVAGATKFNYWRLWNFAIEGFTSFTIAPLKIATYMGIVIAGYAFIYATWIIVRTLLRGDPVPGYPSLLVVILLLGGVQLITIGVLGEYVGRMFNETKQRPLYLLNEYAPGDFKDAHTADQDATPAFSGIESTRT